MKWIFIILIVALIIWGSIWAIKKFGKTNPSDIPGHNAFIKACSTPPYSNALAECENAWTLAQGLGISDYAGWAKWNCDQGHC